MGTNYFTGALPTAKSVTGITGETWLTGTLTCSRCGSILGGEFDGTIGGVTGNPTIPSLIGVYGGASIQRTASVTVTNAFSFYAPAPTNAGGVASTIVNAYSLYAEKPTAGTTNNFSIWAAGPTMTLGQANFNNSEAGKHNVVIYGDALRSANDLQIADTHPGGHTWNIGEEEAAGQLSFRDITQTGTPYWSLAVTGHSQYGGVLTHANTTSRTYVFPDMTGIVALTNPLVFPEGSAPSTASANDVCYGDSAAHALKCSYNNGAFGTVPISGVSFDPSFGNTVIGNGSAITSSGAGGTMASCPSTASCTASLPSSFASSTMYLTTNVAATTVTAVLQKAVTMPLSGCPCRVLVSYGSVYTVGSQGTAETWVSDGTNNFANTQAGINAPNLLNMGLSAADISPVTYANNATVTFTVNIEASQPTRMTYPTYTGTPYIRVLVFSSN
jgi:hypothetical protein